jgi:cysteinyl-tRNA synthetase
MWRHGGMVTIRGEKMSNSLGNTKSVDFVLKKYGTNVIRLFCLSGHYSKPVDYSEDMLEEIITKWRQVENCYYELILADDISEDMKNIEFMEKAAVDAKKEFFDSLNYDFNTSLAICAFFKLVKATNQITASERLTKPISDKVLPVLELMFGILGLKIPKVTDEEKKTINALIQKREVLRGEEKFQEADWVRKELLDTGIMLIDHKKKVLWMKQEKIGGTA